MMNPRIWDIAEYGMNHKMPYYNHGHCNNAKQLHVTLPYQSW